MIQVDSIDISNPGKYEYEETKQNIYEKIIYILCHLFKNGISFIEDKKECRVILIYKST